MNIFARIERLEEFQFELVKYYSVHFEGNDVNEFYDFLNRMEDNTELKEDILNLLVWIEEVDENIEIEL